MPNRRITRRVVSEQRHKRTKKKSLPCRLQPSRCQPVAYCSRELLDDINAAYLRRTISKNGTLLDTLFGSQARLVTEMLDL